MTYRTVTSRSLIAVGALVLSLAVFATVCVTRPVPLADTRVYRAEGAAVLGGDDPYGIELYGPAPGGSGLYGPGPDGSGPEGSGPDGTGLDGTAYPPFAAILFVPTTWLSAGALKVAFVLGNIALLALLVRLSLRLVGRSPTAPVATRYAAAATLAVAAGLWLEPVARTILLGEITLAVACLVLWDLSRPDHALGKGFALGIAAGITLTPALFIAYLLLTSRVRQGLTALAALTGTVLLGMLVLPYASGEFWTNQIFRTDRAGAAWAAGNQSLHGLLARLLHTPEPGAPWVVAALLTAAAGLWTARRAVVRAGSESWGILLTALTALLVTPVSWSHEWVWCVPLLAALLAEHRLRTAALAGAVWTARSFWAVPYEGEPALRLPWWQQPLISPYALCALALLAHTAWRHTRTRAGTGPLSTLPGPRSPRGRPLTPR
ncbi:glycosyltransferase 87 family protein [Streptomyces sp. JV176]|uniref:glycosyltransferase 87 family protein n=1 Tax=Streptomyces sp. JV176 TaxID=858630 RepID=UPI002E795326|nr:glycosyltransferase 87 family protein [Streptomyces sp. JV176]MEE1800528.1 glycosyltransferase 87 family protein [Streptomyces sp. JV176]